MFIAEPVVYVPRGDPRRVLLVLVDTLRADHLGVYGYARDTSPALDAWAAGGMVFEQARSPAPWTMPSARAAVSGREPERWMSGPHIGEHLGRHGFTTVAVVGNSWLSEAFGFSDGWSTHHHQLGDASARVGAARRWMARYPDRDLLVLLHLMDPHLPYEEPEALQGLFAGPIPPELGDRMHPEEINAGWARARTDDARDDVRAYLTARYDQNIRHVDQEVAPLLDELSDALIVLFSDHGEELWQRGEAHGHGHSLHDELLRVPLVVRGPGVPAGRSDAPVGLTDIVPTILDVFGLPSPAEALDGASLLRAPPDRPQGFGWLMYGDDGWGAVVGGKKWITRGGAERVYDLAADPGEESAHPSPPDTAAFREGLATVRGRPLVEAVRIVGPGELRAMRPSRIEVTLTHPDATFQEAWVMWDPRDNPHAPIRVEGSTLHMAPRAGDLHAAGDLRAARSARRRAGPAGADRPPPGRDDDRRPGRGRRPPRRAGGRRVGRRGRPRRRARPRRAGGPRRRRGHRGVPPRPRLLGVTHGVSSDLSDGGVGVVLVALHHPQGARAGEVVERPPALPGVAVPGAVLQPAPARGALPQQGRGVGHHAPAEAVGQGERRPALAEQPVGLRVRRRGAERRRPDRTGRR